ncbi:primosomal protein N' [Zafaria sp. Z1313]|uniref:primosomal protein N' n=1 Tax=Zafaria sp. Z1313 TaxID=3423202 RepID=UPI003D303158
MDASQPSLLTGFDTTRPIARPAAARELPVARVLLETQVPHLDRYFDYLVPAELADEAQPGVRIKARFGGQELPGFIVERRAESDAGVKLQPLGRVVSPERVLEPGVLALCEAVAARYAGSVSDVVRSAVPPRMARVEKEDTAPAPPERTTAEGDAPDGTARDGSGPGPWDAYDGGAAFLSALASGGSPRAVATVAPNTGGWPLLLATAVAACLASGRTAVVVVPDARDLARLDPVLTDLVGPDVHVRLTADDGATPRYRSFLRAARGQVRVVVGTRSAAFAPLPDLGLVVLWEDHDASHAEPRAPYHHARETLLLRAGQSGCALLIASHGRSAEAQRLVLTGWAGDISLPRPALRRAAPRVVASSDSYEQERDPLLHAARLPQAAWKAAAAALERGPVLVQVARTGFVPTLRCQHCRTAARCGHCSGPLAMAGPGAAPGCRWCGRQALDWRCAECGSPRLRAGSVGADRTAEELGRAFPRVPVVSSTGAKPRAEVDGRPALVVSTPGVEPVCADGYAAVLLLDGDRMLSRDGLRTPEEVLQRWLAAASLARAGTDGGTVVVASAGESDPLRALVRWDPAGFAARELEERRGLGLPPAVRSAVVTGPAAAADAFIDGLALPAGARTAGPVLQDEGRHQWIVFFSYADGAAVTAALRERRAVASAQRAPVVTVRVDPEEAL